MATGSSILTLQKQRQLLELEYEEEKRLFEKQTETTGINRKIRQGVCWFPLRVRKSYYNSLNQFTIEVERTEQLDTDHNFEPGKPVCFFTEEAVRQGALVAQGIGEVALVMGANGNEACVRILRINPP